MNERRRYNKIGKKASKRGDRKVLKEHQFDSYWTQPCNRYTKRLASKAVRRELVNSGMEYKKHFDSFYWS